MSHDTRTLRIALRTLNRAHLRTARRREPVAVGVPLPRAAVRSGAEVRAVDLAGRQLPLQCRALDLWPDGSVRWLLCELLVDADSGTDTPAFLVTGGEPQPAESPFLTVASSAGGVRVDTGRAVFALETGRPFPFGGVISDGREYLDERNSGLVLDLEGQSRHIDISTVEVRTQGPIHCEVHVQGTARGGAGCPLEVEARLEFFAGSPVVRAQVTHRNPRPAEHPGGCWVLGDKGSVLVRSVCTLGLLDDARAVRASMSSSDEYSGPPPFELHQESSGGPGWDGRVHCNRDGQVALRFRGYRVRAGGEERSGLRATPVVQVSGGAGTIDVAVPKFWENFPQSIRVDQRCLEVGFFPRTSAEPQELQGGEQKTHTMVVAFGADTITSEPLAWVHDPLLVAPAPEWIAETDAVPFLSPSAQDPFPAYLELIATALDDEHGFAAKQERADEYGWRNFGDLPADHESAFLPAGQINVSHYNNQYDALAWFAIHFMRSGDPRWHTLMCDLAAHVRDIDIYHTTGDKAAYNGGLFWHTDHYVDAATSTHRTYPAGSNGGGPSNEHNYNLGLLLHYLLTGDDRSRDATIGLGQWVLEMDDGARTVFRWLARGATGLASATGSSTYHGPGRGAANSILACMMAHRLTGDARFTGKIDEIVRRCIHPGDDLTARRLDDVERRWYYTVFLQALGQYLHAKWERQEFDEMFEYGRASLLHYSGYIADREKPYLDHPERLEFPTETWVAQDLRKGDALLWAAFFAPDADTRRRFLQGADRFFDYAVPTLRSMATHVYTRPTILALALGWRRAWFATHALPAPMPALGARRPEWGTPQSFVPQKQVAFSRARWIAGGGIAAVALVVAVLLAELL